MDQLEELAARDWDGVVLTLHYRRGGKLQQVGSTITHAEIQEAERAMRREPFEHQRGGETDPDELDAIVDGIDRANQFELSQEDFKNRVLEAADRLLRGSIKLPGKGDNEIVVLPPTANEWVSIEVLPERRVWTP